MKQIITSLDVGSNTIKLIVGEIFNNKLNVLSCLEVKSKGIKKGVIVDNNEALVSFNELLSKSEEVLGIEIKNVIAVVPSYYAEFIVSEGYTTITREDNTVTGEDIVRALQSSIYNKVPANKELISITPVEFKINDKDRVKDPKGKKAKKLGVKSIIAITPKKHIYNLLSLLESIGINVIDMNFSGICDYYEFKTPELDEKLGAVINIGSEKTEVSIINKGILVDVENIPLGGKNITRDISYIYDVSSKISNQLKEKFAYANKVNSSTSETEEVLTKSEEHIKINQYEVSEIIYSRIKEILELSKKQINLLTKKEISYIIITGGTTEIMAFNSTAEEVFGKSLEKYSVKEMGVRHNKYSSVLGMIKYYNEKLAFRNKLAFTIEEEKQNILFSKKMASSSNILGKIYGYFFDN